MKKSFRERKRKRMEKNDRGREEEGNEELGGLLESFRWCIGKFGEGSSRGHKTVGAPGYCKQMSRGKGGESPPSLPLSSVQDCQLGFLDSSKACKACCTSGLP